MPANLDQQEEASESEDSPSDARPAHRSRLTQELYGEPSAELTKSKEGVIRLEHTLQRKLMSQQIRQMDDAAAEEQTRTQEAARIRAWREPYIRLAVTKVPAEACAEVCARINSLLDSVPPFTDVTAQVVELIQIALRPIRKREAGARALEEHAKKLSAAVESIRLPPGASFAEVEEARELARAALANLPAGCSDYQLRTTAETAIRPIADRIAARKAREQQQLAEEQQRRADEMRRSQEGFFEAAHKAQLADAEIAKAIFRSQRAPIGYAEMGHEIQKRIDDLNSLANATRRADSLLPHVTTHLEQLEDDGTITFEDDPDFCELRDKVTRKIRPLVVERIASNPSLRDFEIKAMIENLVDEHYGEFCDD